MIRYSVHRYYQYWCCHEIVTSASSVGNISHTSWQRAMDDANERITRMKDWNSKMQELKKGSQ